MWLIMIGSKLLLKIAPVQEESVPDVVCVCFWGGAWTDEGAGWADCCFQVKKTVDGKEAACHLLHPATDLVELTHVECMMLHCFVILAWS
jgi:hypothetical protein